MLLMPISFQVSAHGAHSKAKAHFFTACRLYTSLARRKQEGKHLGRKKGDMPKMKILAENKKQLLKEQKKGTSCLSLIHISIRSICA